MRNTGRIALFTIGDLSRDRSVLILGILGILLVFVIRGCFGGTYTVNEENVDRVTVAWHVARAAFQVITGIAVFMGILMTGGIFRRDRSDGALISMVSRPIARSSYVAGRSLGVTATAGLFMVALHVVVFILVYIQTRATIPWFLAASALCMLNIGCAVFLTALFLLFLPDAAAIVLSALVVVTSYVSNALFRVMSSESVRSIVPGLGGGEISPWRRVFPKIGELQSYAVSLTDTAAGFTYMAPLHPVINVLMYTVLAALLLVFLFGRQEL